ncbi:MerR family transcriptional regulator [Streptomyces sp. NPDC093093]|uniref:MerR family transcriptional regulator n=1 Tax=Streptomyces sp. NPDC093093 TaxID=3366025 RepID=UPI0038144601
MRRHEETGLVVLSARSQGGFRLCPETDVQRLMVIRRMKPLGFTLVQMRDLLDAIDRLDHEPGLDAGEREVLLERSRVRAGCHRAVDKLRIQVTRAEDFAATLRGRLHPAPHRKFPQAAEKEAVGVMPQSGWRTWLAAHGPGPPVLVHHQGPGGVR